MDRGLTATQVDGGSSPSSASKMEGTAEWPATGLENLGRVTPGRSIRLPSAT
jgi:hypothetical protein